MKGEKMPQKIGADGRLYYNFAKGLKVAMHGSDRDKNEDYTLEIIDCHYTNGTEYYGTKQDGVLQAYVQSANRIKYLLSRYGVKTLAEGKLVELPLIIEEVDKFYNENYRKYLLACQKAKEIPEYMSLKSEAWGYSSKIGMAQAFGRTDEANELKAKRNEAKQRAEAVLKAHNIDPADVEEPLQCPLCKGHGHTVFGICSCAYERAQEIKAFCAEERRKLAKLMQGQF